MIKDLERCWSCVKRKWRVFNTDKSLQDDRERNVEVEANALIDKFADRRHEYNKSIRQLAFCTYDIWAEYLQAESVSERPANIARH